MDFRSISLVYSRRSHAPTLPTSNLYHNCPTLVTLCYRGDQKRYAYIMWVLGVWRHCCAYDP